jgi:hypothetical protein
MLSDNSHVPGLFPWDLLRPAPVNIAFPCLPWCSSPCCAHGLSRSHWYPRAIHPGPFAFCLMLSDNSHVPVNGENRIFATVCIALIVLGLSVYGTTFMQGEFFPASDRPE